MKICVELQENFSWVTKKDVLSYKKLELSYKKTSVELKENL